MGNDAYKVDGPVLILAGPGTGKTYTLALRLKYLVEDKSITPDDITIITFTTEAAKNLRNRISNPDKPQIYLPYIKQPSNIITMHSLGLKILRQYSEIIGLSSDVKVIYDDFERSIILRDAAQLSGYKRSFAQSVSDCRQFGDCKENKEDPKCIICATYKNILRKCSSVDYDEMILLAVDLLRSHPEILAEYQLSTKHLLVDEYQDINKAQFDLIQLLTRDQIEGLFVVGDDDQSIYGWRGGSPKYIREFEKDFQPDAKIIPLNKSYRCHKNILEGSLSIVKAYDTQRLHKDEFEYEMENGSAIKIHNVPSDKKEAIIVRKIVQYALPSQNVLILIPNRNYIEAISSELRRYQISFSAHSNVPGEGLPVIYRLNDWLIDPKDNIAFRRCIESFINRVDSDIPSKKVRKAEKKRAREIAFNTVSKLWIEILSGNSESIWNTLNDIHKSDIILNRIWEAFNILYNLYQDKANIVDFSTNLSKTLSPWKKIPNFLDEITAWVDSIRQFKNEGIDTSVRIMTFQGAKGLEAKVVCVLGLEEGVIPRADDENISEQSRLLFVSMTRAINELHLFHARLRSGGVVMRNIFRNGRPDINKSRFIDAIPTEYRENLYHRA